MFFVLSITLVNADVGPKSSVSIKVLGIKEQYFITLLSDTQASGPYESDRPYTDKDMNYEMFKNYNDEFYFLYNMSELDGEGTYSWNYYPPDNFKILIYIHSTNKYIKSQQLDAFAFSTLYSVKVEDNEIIDISKEYVTGFTISDYLIRLILTLLIEVSIALIFKFRGYELKVIVITNIITQTLLLFILMIFNYKIGYFGEMLIILPIELIVLAIEIIIYNKYLDACKHPVVYALVANLFSFLLGMYLLVLLMT